MKRPRQGGAIDRRTLLVGGGAGAGLVVAWAVWPRAYRPNLTAAPGETILGAWLKIAEDGRVVVAVPQAEHGQGIWTALAQVVADELGADWRTVGVEAAQLNPLYANPLALDELLEGTLGAVPNGVLARHATDADWMLTGGSTSLRMFERACRQAGAGARALLCKAAARRWAVDWTSCDTRDGFVVHERQRLRFGEVAAAAAGESLPDPVTLRPPGADRLSGKPLPRLDTPAKVDGSAQFAADVRLPDMVFASVRSGPAGDTRLVRVDKAAASHIRGLLEVVETPHWVAAVATDWWAADRALDALAPRFETHLGIAGRAVDSAGIAAALDTALAGPGQRMIAIGDVAAQFHAAHLIAATYRVAPGVHAAIETAAATARWHDGRLEVWLPTQAPAAARDAAAAAIGVAPAQVTVHPMLIGGSFGAALETGAAAQAAVLALKLRRPVQVTWSRAEDLRRDACRSPAVARMAARLGASGQIAAWEARIAAPATGRELARRLFPGDRITDAALALAHIGDPYAIAGAEPPYRIPALAIDHHPADIGLPTGHVRGGAHGYTAFFTESFIDELAHAAGTEALSYRIAMLGGDPRLARCLSTAASLGGWDGGGQNGGQNISGGIEARGGQGLACHAFRGSRIAVLAEARVEAGRIRVDRLVAAVDCGQLVNPDLVRQQIEGGLVFGMAQALGASTGFTRGLPDAHGFGALALPRLADVPDITVELIRSEAEPGGAGELAVPPVAPALANALFSATGARLRTLPLVAGGA